MSKSDYSGSGFIGRSFEGILSKFDFTVEWLFCQEFWGSFVKIWLYGSSWYTGRSFEGALLKSDFKVVVDIQEEVLRELCQNLTLQ